MPEHELEMPEWLVLFGRPTNTIRFNKPVAQVPTTYLAATGERVPEIDAMPEELFGLLGRVLSLVDGVFLVHAEGREVRFNATIVTDLLDDDSRMQITLMCAWLWNSVSLDALELEALHAVSTDKGDEDVQWDDFLDD